MNLVEPRFRSNLLEVPRSGTSPVELEEPRFGSNLMEVPRSGTSPIEPSRAEIQK